MEQKAPDVELSVDQVAALDKVKAWLSDPGRPQVFRLFGHAGSGKTTLAAYVERHFAGRTHFMAPTGKAALRLQAKHCLGATTIHRFLYDPVGEKVEKDLRGNETYSPIFGPKGQQHDLEFDHEPTIVMAGGDRLIIVDEASMIGREIGEDLIKTKVPIVAIGDPAQLPPVKDLSGYFTESEEYPADTPDVFMKESHRHAGRPVILRAATAAREGRLIPFGDFDTVKVQRSVRNFRDVEFDFDAYDEDTQVICGTHNTRITFNRQVRAAKQFGEFPEIGDRVMCFRNKWDGVGPDRRPVFMNGEIFRVIECQERGLEFLFMRVRNEVGGRVHEFRCWKRPFQGKTWDEARMTDRPIEEQLVAEDFHYAWAITCHKSQGSEWKKVTVLDEASTFRDFPHRWRYTAVTRASEQLVIVRRS